MLEMKLVNPVIRQYIVVITVNLCMLSTGMGLVWSSPVLVKLSDESQTVLPRPITAQQGSWIVSIGWGSMIISIFLVMYLVDRIGRKYCLLISCSSRLITTVLFTVANEYWMILLARILTGFADAFGFGVTATYTSEIASKEIRGALASMLQICSSIGVVIMLSIGPFVSYFALNLMYTVVTVAVWIPLWFVPDSPYFLYSKGRINEATQLLIHFRGSEMLAKEEIKEYALVNKNNNEKTKKKDLLRDKIVLKSFILVIVLAMGLQLSGFNAVSFYLQTILESTNSTVRSEIASVITGMIQLFAAFCAASTTDRFGRKPIIFSTLSGMTLGMIGLGYFFTVNSEGQAIIGIMNYVPLVSIILVVFCYSSGIGCLIWSLFAELFDGPSRGVGVVTSQCVSSICAFLTTKYFPIVTVAIGPSITYWFFATVCVLMLIFIAIFVPETKGKSFAEIQRDLSGEKEHRVINSV